MKKEIMFLIMLIVLINNIYAFSFLEALGWGVSIKEGNWEVKALCAVAKGVACEGAQILINPQGYIESKSLGALSEASPELGKAIGLVTNPQGFITQEALKQIVKDNPKEAGGLGQVLTTVDQLKTIGVKKGDFKFDKDGYVSEGNFISEKDGKIGNLVGKDVKQDSLQISKGIKFDKKDDLSTLTFTDNNQYAKINDNLFMNVKKGGILKLNDKGELIEADIISSDKGGSYTFGNEIVKVPSNTRVTYKDGQIKVYGNGKSFDLSNSLEGKVTTNIKILDGDSVTIIGNKVIGKKFEGKEFKVSGLDNELGEVTFSNGNIVNIGKSTDAIVKGIEHTVTNNLNLYYDTNFDPLGHTNENYFNYGKNKIQLGCSRLISSLQEGNEVFPQFESVRNIQGKPVPKKGVFELIMNDGTLEIEKDMERKEDYNLFFNVKSKGNFEIKDGRTTFILENEELYTKQNQEFGISYGINLDNEYISDGFLIKDKDGNVIINNYLPWENTIRKTNEIDQEVMNKNKQTLQKNWGVRPRTYFGYMDDEREEDLIKWIYESSEIASQNKYNIKVSPSEVFTTFMLEGGADPKGPIEGKNGYYYNHNTNVYGFGDLGLDYIGKEMSTLKKAGFVLSDIELSKLTNPTNEQGVSVSSGNFNNLEDGLMVQAGNLAYRKSIFLKDFKNYFGENEFNELTDDEIYFWTSFYYNCGPGCGKGELTGTQYISGRGIKVQGQGRNKIYKTLEYPEPSSLTNPRVNALIRVSTKQWIDSLGLFDFP